MNGKYRYGDKPATVTDAAGVSGVLIKGLDGDFTFRVYDKDGEFTDYDLNHDDLSVTIAADEMASFYSFGESRVLDHSPCVGVGESGGVISLRLQLSRNEKAQIGSRTAADMYRIPVFLCMKGKTCIENGGTYAHRRSAKEAPFSAVITLSNTKSII